MLMPLEGNYVSVASDGHEPNVHRRLVSTRNCAPTAQERRCAPWSAAPQVTDLASDREDSCLTLPRIRYKIAVADKLIIPLSWRQKLNGILVCQLAYDSVVTAPWEFCSGLAELVGVHDSFRLDAPGFDSGKLRLAGVLKVARVHAVVQFSLGSLFILRTFPHFSHLLPPFL